MKFLGVWARQTKRHSEFDMKVDPAFQKCTEEPGNVITPALPLTDTPSTGQYPARAPYEPVPLIATRGGVLHQDEVSRSEFKRGGTVMPSICRTLTGESRFHRAAPMLQPNTISSPFWQRPDTADWWATTRPAAIPK